MLGEEGRRHLIRSRHFAGVSKENEMSRIRRRNELHLQRDERRGRKQTPSPDD